MKKLSIDKGRHTAFVSVGKRNRKEKGRRKKGEVRTWKFKTQFPSV